VGEEAFCDARAAVRFPGGALSWRMDGTLNGFPSLGWAYRRLLSDGRGVNRVEVGVSNRHATSAPGPGPGIDAVARACATSPLELRGTDGGWSSTAWPQAGRLLAPLLLRSTTRIVPGGFEPDGKWIRQGQPLFLAEYASGEHSGRTLGRPMALADMPGIELSYALSEVADGHFGTWFLGVGETADADAVRRLRVHLLRIHAERECLKLVLRAIADETVQVERGHEATERLQAYLNDVLNRVFKPSYLGIRVDVLRAAYESDEIVGEAERATLYARLVDIRGNVKRKLEERTAKGWFIAPGGSGG
jgi:hypothetical protein